MGWGSGWGGVGGGSGGGQGRCKRRSEVFVKIEEKKFGGGGGGWVGLGQVGGRVGGGGFRVDVNTMLGVGVMWGTEDVNQE